MALALAASSTAAKAQTLYSNPVIGLNCPDPSIIDDRGRSGYFYLYTTQTSFESALRKDSSPVVPGARIINLPIYRSTDLVNWEFVGDGFPNGHPDWVKNANLWAPDINYIDGKYVLYYALGKWGGIFSSACGVAVSDSPEGPFEDYDRLVDFRTMGTLNSIDPNYFSDETGSYLLWGSLGGGIYGIELTDDGLFVKPGAKKKLLTALNTEGAFLYERDGWYYLFASAGSCCRGQGSTYHIIVGRAKHPLGPYTGPDGQSMLKLNYRNTILSSSRDKVFIGPGHNSEIITDDEGNDWIFYHSYNAADGYASRQLHLDRIKWNYNGWPYFEMGEPSGNGTRPVFSGAPVKPIAKAYVPAPGEKTKATTDTTVKIMPKKAADTATGLTGDTGDKKITTAKDPVKVTETIPEFRTPPDDEYIQLPGGWSQQRDVSPEELEMFRKLTKNSGLILAPVSVATQVVAGLNYDFVCKIEDASRRSNGECRIRIFKPLAGEPEITDMSLIK